jgi:hypothetical protein
MEPRHRRRSYLGMRGRPEGRVSRLLHRLILLRGVGLSRPDFCEIRKNLKLLFKIQSLAEVVAFMLPCIIFGNVKCLSFGIRLEIVRIQIKIV